MDYIKEALRTKSNQFFPQNVSGRALDSAICSAIIDCNKLDAIKKALFYGKGDNVPNALAAPDLSAEQQDLLHGALGVMTEASELLMAVSDHVIDGDPLDTTNAKEEIGDLMWYMAVLCNVLGTTFEAEQERNIAKLRARYPKKFTSEAANNRDLDNERKIMEG